MDKNVIRILLLGKSGVGKSSFINYFLGVNEAEVGFGEPCTQEITKYILNQWDNCTIEIYDSKGLEVYDADEWRERIMQDIETRNSGSMCDWYHTIFYCISAIKKVETYEIELINAIQKASKQHINVIITNCDGASENQLNEREKYLREKLSEYAHIYRVVSVKKRKRNGTIASPYGRDDILDNVFKLFWDNMSSSIAHDVSRDIDRYVKRIMLSVKNDIDSFIKEQAGVFKMIRHLYSIEKNDSVDELLDRFGEKMEAGYDELYKSATESLNIKLEEARNLYNSYANIADPTFIIDAEDLLDDALNPIMEKLDDIDDIEDILLKYFTIGKVEKILEEMDDIDDDDILAQVKSYGKAFAALGFGLVKLKREALKAVDNLFWDLYIESREIDYEKMLYDKLMSIVDTQ